ncbi:type II secretion system protein [Nitrospira sp. Nam80]
MSCNYGHRDLLRNDRGSIYLLMMMVVVLMGISLSAVAKQWKMVVQREKEAELMARGIEIQSAILSYSTAMKKARITKSQYFPMSLKDLVNPPSPFKPFLRKLYTDPMTGGEWDYFRDSYGRIMGVKSRSTARPIKLHNFPLAIQHFEGQIRYSNWIFMTVSSAPVLSTGSIGIPRLQPPTRR